MMNHISLMGRMVRDPELRRTGSGTAVASFTLAVERDYKSESGDKATDFIDMVAWRSTAEFVTKYFHKGELAAVTGRLQIRNWEDEAGNKRRSAEVVTERIYFAGGNHSSKSGPTESSYGTKDNRQEYDELFGEDDDLPF